MPRERHTNNFEDDDLSPSPSAAAAAGLAAARRVKELERELDSVRLTSKQSLQKSWSEAERLQKELNREKHRADKAERELRALKGEGDLVDSGFQEDGSIKTRRKSATMLSPGLLSGGHDDSAARRSSLSDEDRKRLLRLHGEDDEDEPQNDRKSVDSGSDDKEKCASEDDEKDDNKRKKSNSLRDLLNPKNGNQNGSNGGGIGFWINSMLPSNNNIKIEEQEKLQAKLADIERSNKSEVDDLELRLKQRNFAIRTLERTVELQREILSNLRDENDDIQKKFEETNRNLRSLEERMKNDTNSGSGGGRGTGSSTGSSTGGSNRKTPNRRSSFSKRICAEANIDKLGSPTITRSSAGRQRRRSMSGVPTISPSSPTSTPITNLPLSSLKSRGGGGESSIVRRSAKTRGRRNSFCGATGQGGY